MSKVPWSPMNVSKYPWLPSGVGVRGPREDAAVVQLGRGDEQGALVPHERLEVPLAAVGRLRLVIRLRGALRCLEVVEGRDRVVPLVGLRLVVEEPSAGHHVG